MRSRTRARQGDFLRVDDRTGFTVWASDTRREWTGAIVHHGKWEARHPQDFLRGRRDNMRVDSPRSEPIALFGGPLMTETVAAASAGAVAIEVLNTDRMQGGDHIGIYLSNGDLHRNIIQEVVDLSNLVLITPLPGAVAVGTKVIDFTAVAV